ncbi:hypothetical protein I79_002638 [Cricetulus griseus]|uniref:Uncharacterized protein n=1 Tax=Cricetulus griseus TaxID=10029 RepID=G3GXZ3_CRIGR|nr:hypothetical protein I79_002638 [Cricetulus griseus]
MAKMKVCPGCWWHMPLTPALGRQREVDLFETSLVYKELAPGQPPKATEKHCLEKQNKTKGCNYW